MKYHLVLWIFWRFYFITVSKLLSNFPHLLFSSRLASCFMFTYFYQSGFKLTSLIELWQAGCGITFSIMVVIFYSRIWFNVTVFEPNALLQTLYVTSICWIDARSINHIDPLKKNKFNSLLFIVFFFQLIYLQYLWIEQVVYR